MSSENDFSVFQHKIERIKLILCACSQKLVCNGNFFFFNSSESLESKQSPKFIIIIKTSLFTHFYNKNGKNIYL